MPQPRQSSFIRNVAKYATLFGQHQMQLLTQDKSFQLPRFATEIDFCASPPRPEKPLEIEMSSDSIVTDETKSRWTFYAMALTVVREGEKYCSLIYRFRNIFENSTSVSRWFTNTRRLNGWWLKRFSQKWILVQRLAVKNQFKCNLVHLYVRLI